MANRPCVNRVICPGGATDVSLEADDPVTNFSSEAIDGITFTGVAWPIFDPYDPTVPNVDDTPPVPCDSAISQDDADLCSGRHNPPGGGNPNPNNPNPTLFGNTAQTCAFECPDGTPFFWTVPPGSFLAANQSTANQLAGAYACKQGLLNAVCISATSPNGCVGQDFECDIGVTGGLAPYGIKLLAGTLPPGFGFAQTSANTAIITGLATTAGNFSVVVQARDSHGNVIAKTINIVILGIANASMIPMPVDGQNYGFQLNGAGGTPPYTFSNAEGLPFNMLLFSSGFLFGDPIGPIAPSFTCTMTDANGVSCNFNLTYQQGCPQFNSLVWPNPPTDFFPPGNGNPFFFNQNFPAPNSIEWNFGVSALGFVPFAVDADSFSNVITLPPGATCKITVQVKSFSGVAVFRAEILNPPQTVTFFDTGVITVTGTGTTTFTFTLPPGVTQIIAFVQSQVGEAGIPISSGLDVVWTFG